MRLDVAVDLDDTPLTADLAKIGGGNFTSWHLTFRYGGSEIAFEASDVADIEEVLDSLAHQLVLLKSGATRTTDGRLADPPPRSPLDAPLIRPYVQHGAS